MTTIPISFIVLGLAFWKRSLLMALGVIVLMATGKIIWSIYNTGEAGKSIIIPAVIGLLLCCGLIFYGFKKLDKKIRVNFNFIISNLFQASA